MSNSAIAEIKPLIDRGWYEESIPLLESLLSRTPSDATGAFWLGLAWYLTGRPVDRTFELFQRAESNGFDPVRIALYAGIAYAETNRSARARESFEAALGQDPSNEYARAGLHRLHAAATHAARPRDYYFPPPHLPHLDADWLEQCSVPQSQQFMIDCLPVLRSLMSKISASELSAIDVGAASGAGANVVATLHSGTFFGKRIRMDAIDLIRRYRNYAGKAFPLVNYICGNLFEYEPDRRWDAVICSHTIEHLADPTNLIRHCQHRARHFALFYAPFDEEKLIPGHLRSIRREYIESLQPAFWEVLTSPGWVHPDDPVSRTVIFVLPGKG